VRRWCALWENPRGSGSISDTLFKNVWQPLPNTNTAQHGRLAMSETRIRIILIIYEYDEENDIVSAIVKFLLI
jgi:hypothetical protein